MTHYEQICKAYIEGREKYIEFRNNSFEAIRYFNARMVNYMGIPQDKIQYVKISGDEIQGNGLTCIGALQYLHDVNMFECGIVMTVEIAPNAFPKQSFLIRFQARWNEDEKWNITIGQDVIRENINVLNEPEMNSLCDDVMALICRNLDFQNDHLGDIDNNNTMKIGFDL